LVGVLLFVSFVSVSWAAEDSDQVRTRDGKEFACTILSVAKDSLKVSTSGVERDIEMAKIEGITSSLDMVNEFVRVRNESEKARIRAEFASELPYCKTYG
jgi:hypothetical protein